jgi:hypothetical protein
VKNPSKKPILLRTQYPTISFSLEADGTLCFDANELGRMFPDEYRRVTNAVRRAEQEKKAA